MNIVFRLGNANNRESPWIERPNLVALGVGLQSKTEQSVAWQILPSQSNVRCVIVFILSLIQQECEYIYIFIK